MNKAMNTNLKNKKTRHCIVSGCTSGYQTNRKRCSLFAVPKEAEVFKIWQKMVPLPPGKILNKNCHVCEKHFEGDFVERFYRHIIDGDEVLLPRGRVSLKKDAVPTIFPGVKHYCLKSVQIQNVDPPKYSNPPDVHENLKEGPPKISNLPKRHENIENFDKLHESQDTGISYEVLLRSRAGLNKESIPTIISGLKLNSSKPLQPQSSSPPNNNSSFKKVHEHLKALNVTQDMHVRTKPETFEQICSIDLPSKFWNKIYFEYDKNIISFCRWNRPESLELPLKKIEACQTASEITCTAYAKNVALHTNTISSRLDLQLLFNDLNDSFVCEGLGFVHELDKKLDASIVKDGTTLRLKSCQGIIEKNNRKRRCRECINKRKLMQNKSYYKSVPKKNLQKEIQALKRSSLALTKKVAELKEKEAIYKTLYKKELQKALKI